MNAPLITAPGAYSDISAEDYHRNADLLPGPSISSSGLKTITAKSPRHYWFDSPLNPDRPAEKDKPHFAIGKAAHDLLLLSERWPECYHVLHPDFNGNATKAQADWHAERDAARETGSRRGVLRARRRREGREGRRRHYPLHHRSGRAWAELLV